MGGFQRDLKEGWHSLLQICYQFAGGIPSSCWAMIFQQVMQSSFTHTYPGLYVLSHTTSISGTSRGCCNPFCVLKPFESWLRGRIKLFKLTLAKKYFPDTLLMWLCWNKVPLYSGSCGRCVVRHTISPPTCVLQVTAQTSFSSPAGALLGCLPNQRSHSQWLPSVSIGPACLLQYCYSYNRSPFNL